MSSIRFAIERIGVMHDSVLLSHVVDVAVVSPSRVRVVEKSHRLT
jgi:hypothetical protein